MALVTITHEDFPGVEEVVDQFAYRYVWYQSGWRSDDDPTWQGLPGPPRSTPRLVRPDLRTATAADWDEVVFSLDNPNTPATALTFEHGQFVARGSGGSGSRSNRRSVFMIPNSPPGYSRMRSRISGAPPSGTGVPQWGHMHSVGPRGDDHVYGLIVWTDIVINSPTTLNLGVWRAEDGEVTFSAPQATERDSVTFADGSRTSNVVTLTGLPSGHGFVVGDLIAVDAADNTYDGGGEVSAVTATTLTYGQTAADDPSAGAGTVRLSTSTGRAAYRANRIVSFTDAVRASNVVTATITGADNHPLQVGDQIVVDAADNTYDGTFVVRETVGGQIKWRQAAADDAGAGPGTITKRFPYWMETEYLPGGILRVRCWPDNGGGVDNAFQAYAGPTAWASPPPWGSRGSYEVDLSRLSGGFTEPDPKFGRGCGLVVAHPTGGATPSVCRYDNVECEAR